MVKHTKDKNNAENALVVFSGGQDSTTCLGIAIKEGGFKAVEAICFDYGQRHKIEIEQAKQVAQTANIPLKLVPLTLLKDLTENALTRSDIDIQHHEAIPNTLVEGRNHLFLSVAAIYAKSKGIKKIYAGMCETDFSGYPDCRDAFVRSLNRTLNLAMDYDFELITPLMWLTKAQTVLKMDQLGLLEWYKHTHTCYEGRRPACGKCPACLLRLKGFEEAGLNDPLLYENF